MITILLIGIGCIVSSLLIESGYSLTKQEAETEYCKLVNSLKYPDSSTGTIDRLCYLEQIGKELAK